jgi:type II secretory pathway component GspD/PulD (secretin)
VSTLTNLVNGLPQTASREADSTLRLKDGETIVIGGLIRDQDIKTVQEVPILAKIPLFGELFRNRNNTKQRSEVLIFITPHILKDGGATVTADAMNAAPTAAATAKLPTKDAKGAVPAGATGKETPKP